METGRNCSPGAISPLFHNFYNLILDFCVITRTRFFLRDKRLFEITEDEITRVDCIHFDRHRWPCMSTKNRRNKMLWIFRFLGESLPKASSEEKVKLYEFWPRGYKTFFVLNSVEHEILNAHKYKNIKKFRLFKAQLILECYFPRSYMLKCQQLLAF